jgi:hypothetical protein
LKPIAHVMKEIEATNAEYYFFVDDSIGCKVDYSRELFTALVGKNVRWSSVEQDDMPDFNSDLIGS